MLDTGQVGIVSRPRMNDDGAKNEAELMSIPQAARRLGCTQATIRNALRDGQIPGIKIRRHWRLHRDVIEGLLDKAKGLSPCAQSDQG